MVATPTAPFVLFIESDSADNDDWITDHAGDPDLITYTNYTEGTEILIFTKVVSRQITAVPGNTGEPRAGGNTFESRTGRRQYHFRYVFQLNSRSDVNNCLKFPMFERHTELASYKDFYLVDLFAANDHITFVDASNNVKSYCKVHITSLQEVWSESSDKKHRITVSGVSVW
jgi:hypothetical protein